MNSTSSGRPSSIPRTLCNVLKEWESARNNSNRCEETTNRRKYGASQRWYPPNFPRGISTLTTVALGAAASVSSSNVPPAAVPISRMVFGRRGTRYSSNSVISRRTWRGVNGELNAKSTQSWTVPCSRNLRIRLGKVNHKERYWWGRLRGWTILAAKHGTARVFHLPQAVCEVLLFFKS